jgi:hypothetical protein
MGHQGHIGEPKRCATQGRHLNQFKILDLDFKSNSESRTTLHST